MTEVSNSRDNLAGGGDSMQAFYDEISAIQDSIKGFNDNVREIGDLHSRSLNNMDEQAASRNAQQLDRLVEETRVLSNELKKRVKSLERKGGSGGDARTRRQQTGVVKQKFMEAIQNYQSVEQQYRARYKQRMERQFKIGWSSCVPISHNNSLPPVTVKPDATPEEIRAVVNDEQGGQVFSQALMSSNRQGESRAAYREVQARHEDIKRIEKTLTELAQLFNDVCGSTILE